MERCRTCGVAMSTQRFTVNGQELAVEKLQKRTGYVAFSIAGTAYAFCIVHAADGQAYLQSVDDTETRIALPVSRAAAGQQQQRVQLGANEALVQEVIEGQSGAISGRASAHAPMPGQVKEVLVALGDSVSAGQPLVVMEAMKLQTTLNAGADGVVSSIPVSAGDMVAEDALLVEVSDGE